MVTLEWFFAVLIKYFYKSIPELIAIGTSNIANSFFQGFPITGSLSRGAVNNASGVRTPLGGLYTGWNAYANIALFILMNLLHYLQVF